MEIRIVKDENYWNVHVGDKNSRGLGWDEMLGQVITLTMPERRHNRPLYAMRTDAEWKEWDESITAGVKQVGVK